VADRYLAVNDGVEALAALGDHPTSPVLILLDVKLPRMDVMAFVEAYQRLRENQQQAVIIVLHTASMSSADLAHRRLGQQAAHQRKAGHRPPAAFSAPVPV
jgi:CheY-like chemotaxis protein